MADGLEQVRTPIQSRHLRPNQSSATRKLATSNGVRSATGVWIRRWDTLARVGHRSVGVQTARPSSAAWYRVGGDEPGLSAYCVGV